MIAVSGDTGPRYCTTAAVVWLPNSSMVCSGHSSNASSGFDGYVVLSQWFRPFTGDRVVIGMLGNRHSLEVGAVVVGGRSPAGWPTNCQEPMCGQPFTRWTTQCVSGRCTPPGQRAAEV